MTASLEVKTNLTESALRIIESILTEYLDDILLSQTPEFQQNFKKLGAEAAWQISRLRPRKKNARRKISKIINGWLKHLPNASRFFVRQEVKIKTDRILRHFDQNH